MKTQDTNFNPKMSSEGQKHKFKRRRSFAYIVLSVCENCGLEREGTKGEYTYLKKTRNPNSGRIMTSHVMEAPPCKTQTP